jgi:hypothetical protein
VIIPAVFGWPQTLSQSLRIAGELKSVGDAGGDDGSEGIDAELSDSLQ